MKADYIRIIQVLTQVMELVEDNPIKFKQNRVAKFLRKQYPVYYSSAIWT